MQIDSAIVRALAITDKALRQQFSGDFHKRCMYSAFGINALLQQLGHRSEIVGGEIVTFMLSRDGRNASMQGFAGGTDVHSHFWVIADNRILDLGPHYLPLDARMPSVAVPLVAWALKEPLPTYLRYRTEQNYGSDVGLIADIAIQQRLISFIELCSRKLAEQVGQPRLPHWLLTGNASVREQAKRGDYWAQGALRFAKVQPVSGLPF